MLAELENVNLNQLKTLYKSNLVARVLLESFACRRNNCWVTSLDTLQRVSKDNGYNFSEVEIRHCCKGFQKAGCGVLKRGYKERKSQFEWKYSPIGIGKAVKAVMEKQLQVI
jgi:hypothetical protein